jgi:Domain of unknown function (DUF4209)
MLSSEEQKLINKYYLQLENISKVNEYIPLTDFNWEHSSLELKQMLSVEHNALCKISPDHINKVFSEQKPETGNYLSQRLAATKNNLLKAKYLHFLYCLETNHLHGHQAIDQYQLALAGSLKSDMQSDIHVEFKDILDVIIQLSTTLNYKVNELKTQIHHYLNAKDIYPRLKTWIIMSIIGSKLYKLTELEYIPALCQGLAAQETEHRFIEINLELGLQVATKLQTGDKQRTLNELLGDNEYKQIKPIENNVENIIVPHQNNSTYIKIIQYYKHAKKLEKQKQAIAAYNANKKHCRFLKISAQVEVKNHEERNKAIQQLFYGIVSSPGKFIFAELISGANLLFIPHQLLDDYREKSLQNKEEEKESTDFFNTMVSDLNNNSQHVDKLEHLLFNMYSECVSQTIAFTTDIILTSILNRKLSYAKAEKFLLVSTYFGQEMTITRNGEDCSYNWMQMIDIGLRDFFKQCQLLMARKRPDWRCTIDFLSLKFEGILRDMVGLTDGVISKVDKNGNTTDLLLDDLLRSSAIETIFTKDDINLFQYVFTSKGYNIRNNVAHSFYKPHDYTINKAILVFLSVMRLAKYRPVEP